VGTVGRIVGLVFVLPTIFFWIGIIFLKLTETKNRAELSGNSFLDIACKGYLDEKDCLATGSIPIK
jgi:hypothetical protein